MKKRTAKRLFAGILALVMMFSLIACGEKEAEVSPSEQETPTQGAEENAPVAPEKTGVTFPLEEEVTLEIMIKDNVERDELLENCALWQDLYEATNVKVEFIPLPEDDPLTALNGMFNAGTQGDAIFSQFISDSDLSALAANDLLMPLNDYINDAELMPNFNNRVLAESPSTEGFVASPDGNIYCLPRYVGRDENYIEGKFFINSEWLEAVGKEVPTTLAELEEVLIAFRDQDPNGNGKKDEIPFLLASGSIDAFSHFEAFMGTHGIATKDNVNDNYVFVEDGVVNFAPTTQNYKDAIKVLQKWYDEGLIWSECFTGTGEAFASIYSAEETVMGMYIAGGAPDTTGKYEPILPPAADGYETNWFFHPGRLGVKGSFCLTNSCENPEIAMAWIDMFYSFENSVRAVYGEPGYQYELTDNGGIEFVVDGGDIAEKQKAESPTLGMCFGPTYQYAITQAFTAEDWAERISYASGNDDAVRALEGSRLYRDAGVLNDEIWPRPYIAAEDMGRLNELRTDIFNTVSEMKASWIAGDGDIDAEWDQYVADLEKMGLAEFIEILQRTYDNFVAAQQ